MRAINNNHADERQWIRVILFARICLTVPKRQRGDRERSFLISHVNGAIREFNISLMPSKSRQSVKRSKKDDNERKASLIMEEVEAQEIGVLFALHPLPITLWNQILETKQS